MKLVRSTLVLMAALTGLALPTNSVADEVPVPEMVCRLAAAIIVQEYEAGNTVKDDELEWYENVVQNAVEECDPVPNRALLIGLSTLRPTNEAERAIVSDANEYLKKILPYDVYVPMAFALVKGDFGTPRNDLALYWIRYAHEIGIPDATYEYGGLYRDGGLGIVKDPVRARELFLQAADRGSNKSMYWLGVEFFQQDGKSRKWKEHERWLQKAAEHGSMDAVVTLAEAYTGDQMTDVFGIKRNIGLGRRYSRIAAEAGNTEMMVLHASYLLRGKDNSKHEDAFFYWMNRAVDAGNTKAAELLEQVGPRLRQSYQETRENRAKLRRPIFKQCPEVNRCVVYKNQYGGTTSKSCAPQRDYWNCG